MTIHAPLRHALLPLLLPILVTLLPASSLPGAFGDDRVFRGVPSKTALGDAVADDLEKVQRNIRDLARKLAQGGFLTELEMCLEGLVATGATEKELAKFQKVIDRLLKRVKPPRNRERVLARHAETTAEVAESLAVLAAELERTDLAQAAVRFDAHNERAQQLLGRVRNHDGVWRAPDVASRLERRHAMDVHLHRALQLDVTLEPAAPQHPLMVEVLGDGVGSAWTHDGLTVESVWPAEKLAAVFRDVLRAMAFSHWLYEGELTPRHAKGLALHLPRPQYQKLVEKAIAAGMVDEARQTTAAKANYTYVRLPDPGPSVYEAWATVVTGRENLVCGALFKFYDHSLPGWRWGSWEQRSSALPLWAAVGHQNLATEACLGAPLPNLVLPEEDGWTLITPGEIEPQYALARAGQAGRQRWLLEQADDGDPPTLDTAMMEDTYLIAGLKLIAATSACQLLYEDNQFGGVLDRFAELRAQTEITGTVRRSEEALGQPIPEFTERWRSWMLHTDPVSLHDLLTAKPGDDDAADPGAPILARLDELREFIGQETLGEFDAELTHGASLHAEYLGRRQLTADDDLHREDVESEDFTTAGAWAARHSLITTDGATDCIDAWLDTFYHRLPLLHPGLQKAGFGQSGDICVLDVRSMVDPAGDWWMPYPYPGQTSVPLAHGPTLPSPVADREDPTTLGYPVTLQLGPAIEGDDLTMKLEKVDGKRNVPVECTLSTPTRPSRPDRAPDGVWCLIPSAPLEPDTTYRVGLVVEGVEREWKFKTGR